MEDFFKTEPRPYQLEDYQKTKRMAYAAYLLDPGLGKTKLTIDVCSYLATKKVIQAVFICSHGEVARNWPLQEIDKHAWECLEHDRFIYDKKNKHRLRLYNEALKSRPADGRVWWFSFNKEALQSDTFKTQFRQFMQRVPSAFIIDESTIIKNANAKVTKAAIAMGRYAKVRRILTGSATPNSEIDLYSQYKFLGQTDLPFHNKEDFMNKYCRTSTNFWGGMRLEGFAKEQWNADVGLFTCARNKEDVLPDLPPKQHVKQVVELPPDERKTYNLLRDQLITELTGIGEEGYVEAVNAVSSLVRMQQLLSGIAVSDQGLKLFESSKFKAVCNFLEFFPRQLILWYRFNHTKDALIKFLKQNKLSYGTLCGNMKSEEKEIHAQEFRAGKRQFLIAHPQTAGWGLTFTNCSDALFVENSFNWEHRIQAEDRIHRIGQTANKCTYYDIVVEDSIDIKIRRNLLDKSNLNGKLTRQELEQWL